MVPRPARAHVGRVSDSIAVLPDRRVDEQRPPALCTHLSRANIQDLASVLTALKAAKRNPGMSELLELDDVLESETPAASTAEVGDILQRHFELSGPVRALPSERDANFRVDTSAGPDGVTFEVQRLI